MAEAAFNCLAVSAFTMAFSLPVARALLAVSLILYGIDCYKNRRLPQINGTMLLAVAFFVIAVVSTLHGVDPAGTWSKLRKLLWYLGIFVYASLVTTPWRLTAIMYAFSAGTGVLALWSLIVNPIIAYKATAAGVPFVQALMDAGSMTDAQRLLAGVLVTLAVLLVCKKEGRPSAIWIIVLLLQGAALLLTFKRGSWICLIAVLGALLALKTNWRYVVGLAAAVLLIALLPPVRGRLMDLGSEFDVGKGGRMTMWFKVAPALHAQHPWLGIGWRAMTNEMMVEIAENVERNRNHLHSNIAEIIVETGWIGFAIYVAWMAKALWDSAAFHIAVRRKTPEEAINSLALLAVLCALLLNGLVEFNFADGEIVLIYCLAMGCSVAGLDRLESQPMGVRYQVL